MKGSNKIGTYTLEGNTVNALRVLAFRFHGDVIAQEESRIFRAHAKPRELTAQVLRVRTANHADSTPIAR